MFFFTRQRDKIYEKIAKPGNNYSVYSNQHYQGEVILKQYVVEEIFQDQASGFYALGLISISKRKHPLLVIRGCGNWGDLKDFPKEFLPYKDFPDILISGSDEQYQAAQKVGVIKWLKKQASLGKKPDLVGQSLGGKIGQQLALDVAEYLNYLVTFNPIGISLTEFKRYQGKIKIFHYINPLDLIPYIFGDKLLPGTIFQTYNPNIIKLDLLSQHNKIILNDRQTKVKKIKPEQFYLNRDIHQVLKNYGKTIQSTFAELKQDALQKSSQKQTSSISQNFEQTYQTIQQEFKQMTAAIWQELVPDDKKLDSKDLAHKKIITSLGRIQEEINKLRKVDQEIRAENDLSDFREIFKNELNDLKLKLQKSFDNFRRK